MKPFVYTSEFADRFWSKVEKTDGCWWWRGTICIAGLHYGYIWLPTHQRPGAVRCGGMRAAHRVSFAMDRGYMPPSYLDVRHDCDHPSCVRPGHLLLGTRLQNVQDRDRRGRGGQAKRRGELNGKAILTVDLVSTIREEHARGLSQAEIARRHGLLKPNVNRVVLRRTWAHVA